MCELPKASERPSGEETEYELVTWLAVSAHDSGQHTGRRIERS